MRGAAFPTSPSNTRARCQRSCAQLWATASMAAMIVWRCARGTSLPSELLALDDAGFRALFSGSPIKRIGRNRFVRNCLYAAGNSGNDALIPQVQTLTEDPDPVVAEAAEWALRQLTINP